MIFQEQTPIFLGPCLGKVNSRLKQVLLCHENLRRVTGTDLPSNLAGVDDTVVFRTGSKHVNKFKGFKKRA